MNQRGPEPEVYQRGSLPVIFVNIPGIEVLRVQAGAKVIEIQARAGQQLLSVKDMIQTKPSIVKFTNNVKSIMHMINVSKCTYYVLTTALQFVVKGRFSAHSFAPLVKHKQREA